MLVVYFFEFKSPEYVFDSSSYGVFVTVVYLSEFKSLELGFDSSSHEVFVTVVYLIYLSLDHRSLGLILAAMKLDPSPL